MKRCLSCKNSFEADAWNCDVCGFEPKKISTYLAFAPELAESNDGMDSSIHDVLDKVQHKNFWFRARNRLIHDLAVRYFPKAHRIMEVGCGTGYVLSALRKAFPYGQITGSEIYANGLGPAERRLGDQGNVLQMDAREIPFTDEFDLICAFDVLEHITEDGDVLAEMHRALKPSGGLLLSVPQHPFLWSAVDDYSFHKRRYTTSELQNKCRKAGFEIVRSTSFVSFLLPLMAMARLKKRNEDKLDPVAELMTSGFMNFALEAVLEGERRLISTGLSFPAGGSRFVAAIKRA